MSRGRESRNIGRQKRGADFETLLDFTKSQARIVKDRFGQITKGSSRFDGVQEGVLNFGSVDQARRQTRVGTRSSTQGVYITLIAV